MARLLYHSGRLKINIYTSLLYMYVNVVATIAVATPAAVVPAIAAAAVAAAAIATITVPVAIPVAIPVAVAATVTTAITITNLVAVTKIFVYQTGKRTTGDTPPAGQASGPVERDVGAGIDGRD